MTDTPRAPLLSEPARRALLEIAKTTIDAHVRGRPIPPADAHGLAELEAPGAAFVTIRKRSDGDLRGCIGTAQPVRALAENVRDLAISASSRDRRFDPVEPDELQDLDVEVSVLSPLAPADVNAIEPGIHGLIVRREGASGLLLPQVARERGWDAQTFLRHTCRKAGLPDDAWRERGTTVLWFTCDVIEDSPSAEETADA